MLLRPRLSHHTLTLPPLHHRHQLYRHTRSPPWPSNSPSASLPLLAQQSHYRRPRDPKRRAFSTTVHQRSQPNHYEILGVSPSITQTELKKRFYVLSKEHHPDLHPAATKSSHVQRFQEISESYSVLGDPEKRRRYDRDVLPRFRQEDHEHAHHRGRTYAGSRAPTGLSKRSSAFRGPPPSYFRHGGGGSYDPNVNPHAHQYSGSSSSSSSSASAGGSGSAEQSAGEDFYAGAYAPPGTAAAGDFDTRGVYRTQTHEDTRRNARRAAAMAAAQAAAEEDGDFWARFVIVSCVLLAGVSLGSLMVSRSGRKDAAGGMVRGDGTRRDKAPRVDKS